MYHNGISFQSSAGPKPGRYAIIAASFPVFIEFQSSAGPKPGRYAGRLMDEQMIADVSILGRA